MCFPISFPYFYKHPTTFGILQLPSPLQLRPKKRLQPIWFKRRAVLCARMSGAFSGSTGESTSTGLPSTSTESEVEFLTDDEAMYETFLQKRDQEIIKIRQDYHFGIAQINCDAQKNNCGDVRSNGDVPRNCGDDQHGHNCRWGILMFWSGVIFLLFDHLWPLPGPAIKARTARNFLSASVLAADIFSPQSNLCHGKNDPPPKKNRCFAPPPGIVIMKHMSSWPAGDRSDEIACPSRNLIPA